VGGDGRTRSFAEARDDVDDTSWDPAFSTRVAAYKADSGVCSAVFKTTVLPVAKTGPIFHDHMRSGKFHGMI